MPNTSPAHGVNRSAWADSRDENLEAKVPGGGGRVKEERQRERLSERLVESLARPTPPHKRKGSHRAVPNTSLMARWKNRMEIGRSKSSVRFPHVGIDGTEGQVIPDGV